MNELDFIKRRKIVFISPRIQGGAALFFAAIVVIGAALFAWLVYHDIRKALWDSTYLGHFRIRTPYQVVHDTVVHHLVVLFLGVLAASFAAYFFLLRVIRKGIVKVCHSLAISAEGDLVTPTDAPGMSEIASFGRQVDMARAHTLARIEEIRAEISFLGASPPLPPGEFLTRWNLLREKIGRLAP